MKNKEMKELDFLAIVNDEGEFLEEFELNGAGVLMFRTNWTSDVLKALKVPVSDYVLKNVKQIEMRQQWADMVGGRLVKIRTVYEVVDYDTGEAVETYDLIEGMNQASKFEAEMTKTLEEMGQRFVDFIEAEDGDSDEDDTV